MIELKVNELKEINGGLWSWEDIKGFGNGLKQGWSDGSHDGN